MYTKFLFLAVATVGFMASSQSALPQAPQGKVKVFLLVGQSNMQGKGSVKHLEELAAAEPDRFGHLMRDGKWVERDDVWIFFSSRKAGDLPTSGRLTVGYGFRPPGKMGPEMGFGKVIGDAFGKAMLDLLEK